MTSEERTLISNLFDRLKQVGAQPKDAEADELIRSKVVDQPAAPYLLVQSTLVMQQALTAAQSRIASLEKQLAGASPAQESGGSFLSGVANLFGVGQPQSPPRPAQTPPPLPTQAVAQTAYSQPPLSQAFPARGGGFLQGALSTAAGVAGGALLFQGIQNLIGHSPGAFAGLAGPAGGLIGGQPAVENTEINLYEANDPAQTTDPSATEDDATRDLDAATADSGSTSDAAVDETFAPDDGGGFFDSDDSYT